MQRQHPNPWKKLLYIGENQRVDDLSTDLRLDDIPCYHLRVALLKMGQLLRIHVENKSNVVSRQLCKCKWLFTLFKTNKQHLIDHAKKWLKIENFININFQKISWAF